MVNNFKCPFSSGHGETSATALGYKWDRKGNIKITNQAAIDVCLECPLAECGKKGTK